MKRLGLLLGCLFGAVPVFSAPPNTAVDQAVAEIQGDAGLISRWMSDQMSFAAPFNATSGDVVPTQLKLFGFELGVNGVASTTKLDVSGLRALPTGIINATQIDTFNRLPMPVILGHAKIGLPFGFDFGLRGGGVPNTRVNTGSTHVNLKNTLLGFDIRNNLIDEGALKPFGLTVGLSYTHAKGSFDTSSDYASNGVVNINGTNYNSALTGYGSTTGAATASSRTDWQTQSWGLQAILDKTFVIVTPYVGGSIHRNFGSPGSTLTASGRETLSDNSGSTFSDFSLGNSATSPVNKWDLRALAGVEFIPLPLFRSTIGVEYAGNKDIAGMLGLRFQFH